MTTAILQDNTSFGPERYQTDRAGYLLVAFFALPFFLFNILPVLFGVYVAFTRWSIVGAAEMGGSRQLHQGLRATSGSDRLQERLPLRR